MPRQGPLLLMIICLGLSSQSLAQEYPFIHYTPKDGLINSRIRNVYQDSKGRMFFLTANGLSIYDGARFNNYSTEDGLANPVVNDMLEISPDSLLLATNTSALNIWVRGKVKNFPIPGPCPVINKFIRATDGRIYVATDNGVYQFDEGRFIKMDADNSVKKRRSSFDDIQEIGHYFLLRVNFDMTHTTGLYLLDRITKKLIPFANEAFNSVTQIPEDNLLLCTNPDRVIAFNLTAAASGIAQPMALPALYQPLRKIKMDAVFIDKKGSIWCVRRNSIVKIPRSGNVLTYDKTTGLDVNNINNVFIDRENILWIQTDGSGLIKLANNNVEIVTGLFSKSATGISAIHANPKSDTTWLFDSEDFTLYCCTPRQIFRNSIMPRIKASQILQEGRSLYIMDGRTIYSAALHPKVHSVSLKLYYQFEKGGAANTNRTIAYGKYLFVPGSGITVVTSGKAIFRVSLPYTDQIVIDKQGRLWASPRDGGLICYNINAENPSNMMEVQHDYTSTIPQISARSIAVDNKNRIWIGTRYQGVFCFEIKNNKIYRQLHFTTADGLTDNFVFSLACDADDNIWVGTQSGLDKISLENGKYIIEGVTRNNNIFQLIQCISVPKNNQVWTLGNSGSILRVTNNPISKGFQPQIQVSSLKTTDSLFHYPKDELTLTHQQNNITFEVAAPSFVDEKQIMFSYMLNGTANAHWSMPSREATLNFINLPHGKYELRIKASFPVSYYTQQEIAYRFTITPPWWDTWWARILFAASLIGMIALIIRNYYLGKLRKQKVLLDRHRAVEEERTRIAMEMHDDLGSGLTTIRYLAGGLSMQNGNSSKEKAEKIVNSAKTLVDNMNDIIWTMKSDNNTLTETLAYIRKQAAEQLETAGIEYHIEFPKDVDDIRLTNELKRSLLLISKEAIHNIVKHSGATNVNLTAEFGNRQLRLGINDNGKGIDMAHVSKFGNGMKSMQKRAEEVKAVLEVLNIKGTTIMITTLV